MRSFFGILKDLLSRDGRFRFAFIALSALILFSLASYWSPHSPRFSFVVPPNMRPNLDYWFGTNSRGQDLFWMMTFATRNSLAFGLMTAALSRVISIFVGLTSGYKGGLYDRVLMAINDSFIVLPVLPILILLNFILRGQMNLFTLSLTMAFFGWAFDARLMRSQVLSLKEREFTNNAIFSGMKMHKITLKEHLPFVMPIVFSTWINNMMWAMGMEVTLSVLGLSNINIATIGTTIYWANQHQALISGVWWWLGAPVAISVLLFLSMYLTVISLNQHLDPRTRLQRIREATTDGT